MHMQLESNYDNLVTACRDAGLEVRESEPEVWNIQHALVLRDNFPVGSIAPTGFTHGKAVLHMDLFRNKIGHFTQVFESLTLQGGLL